VNGGGAIKKEPKRGRDKEVETFRSTAELQQQFFRSAHS